MVSRKWLSLTHTKSTIPEKYKVTRSENYAQARAHSSQSPSAWVSIHHKPVCALTFIFYVSGNVLDPVGHVSGDYLYGLIYAYHLTTYFLCFPSILYSPFLLLCFFFALFLCVYFTFFIGLSAIALCYFRHCLRIIAHYILIYYYLYMVIHNKSYI